MGVNEKGQTVLEAVLLIVVLVGLSTFLMNGLKKMDYVATLTVDPWARVSGMIECGVWSPCGLQTPSPGQHPSNRVISYRPVGNL